MKFTPGPLAGELSGALGNTVFSHNRGGPYTRMRAIPITSTSEYSLAAKQRLALLSANWQMLLATSRLSWENWADANPIVDTLGMRRILTGHQAYVALNARILRAGAAAIIEPPVTPAPGGLLTLTATCDFAAADFELTFTPETLDANHALWVYGCVVSSAGINFVQNFQRLFTVSATAETSPFGFSAAFNARFGIPELDQIVHIKAHVIDTTSGLISLPLLATATVISTPAP